MDMLILIPLGIIFAALYIGAAVSILHGLERLDAWLAHRRKKPQKTLPPRSSWFDAG